MKDFEYTEYPHTLKDIKVIRKGHCMFSKHISCGEIKNISETKPRRYKEKLRSISGSIYNNTSHVRSQKISNEYELSDKFDRSC